MPRVTKRTRKRATVKRAMRCAASPCVVAQERLAHDGEPTYEQQNEAREIRVGEDYYTWARKMGRSGAVYFQHAACGYPKRSQLSSRKTVAVEEAISEAQTQIQGWSPELDEDGCYSGGIDDVRSSLAFVAETAREVGQEYQDSFDNMPEGLNQGSAAQAMEEVAQELESWADDLESWDPQSDEPELPERGEDQDEGDWRDACQDALETWADDVRSDADDKLSEMPEYQG